MWFDKLFSIPFLGRRIMAFVVSREGGEMRSKTLRRIFENKYQITVGLHSYGGCFSSSFNTGGRVVVGRYCSIAKEVHYFGANHPIDYVSTSPYFYNKKFGNNVKDVSRKTLTVGNDVWIGYGAIICSSCECIGNGAIIGAGAVVTRNVQPYSIVAGNPCRQIRKRFDEETINKLENSKWYELEPEELAKWYEDIGNPIQFANKIAGRD